MPWCLIARQRSCALVLVGCAYAGGIRKIRINTRENGTEKIHENGGKKSVKRLAQAGNCYIRRPPAHSSASHVWRISQSHHLQPCVSFPPVWTVLTTDEYETATPRITGDVTMEIFCAQLRLDPRQLLGSPRGFQDPGVRGGPGAAHSHPVLQGLAREGPQCWARDLAIRANIFSTGWIDVAATVGMREMEVFDKDGAGILNELWLSERTDVKDLDFTN
jgi:hypothetical protein